MHDTVDVLAPEAGTTALGSAFGSREHIKARAWESVRACDESALRLAALTTLPPRYVLTRRYADVSKLMNRMRINGDMLDWDLLDHSWWQATTGVSFGGLGIALPAFVASRIMCRSLVSTMVGHFSRASGVPNQPVMAEYDSRTDVALARLVATLPPNAAQVLLGHLDEALAERELSWRNVHSGVEDAMQDQLPPFGTLEASPRMTVMGTTSTLRTEARENPGSHHHMRGLERAFRPASDAAAGGLLNGSRATAGTWGR